MDKGVFQKKLVPEELKCAAEEALSAFPELQNTPIYFLYRPIRTATMQARPWLDILFRRRSRRSYVILIKKRADFSPDIPIHQLPHEVLVGWFAHELGHIMDFKRRNLFSMLRFLFGYLYDPTYRTQAEKTADFFAIQRGMGKHIVSKRSFLSKHHGLSQAYRERLRRHYLSPEDAQEFVTLWNQKPQALRV
ncbi:MAG: hypothetical protein AAF694_00150 [Bacteroidota bacterium]